MEKREYIEKGLGFLDWGERRGKNWTFKPPFEFFLIPQTSLYLDEHTFFEVLVPFQKKKGGLTTTSDRSSLTEQRGSILRYQGRNNSWNRGQSCTTVRFDINKEKKTKSNRTLSGHSLLSM